MHICAQLGNWAVVDDGEPVAPHEETGSGSRAGPASVPRIHSSHSSLGMLAEFDPQDHRRDRTCR